MDQASASAGLVSSLASVLVSLSTGAGLASLATAAGSASAVATGSLGWGLAGAAIIPSVIVLGLSQVAPAFTLLAFGLIRCATTVSVSLALSRSRLYAGSAEIPARQRI